MGMDEVREILARACRAAGSNAAWAALHDISPTYVSDVLRARKDAGKKILRALSLTKAIASSGLTIDTEIISQRRSYRVWRDMKSRCQNKNHQNFHHYGGRGITVCDRWLSYRNFVDDMGEPPVGMSIERTNNDAGYSPDNCVWADQATQTANRRVPPGRPKLVSDDAIRSVIALGTKSGADALGFSRSGFIKRRKQVEKQVEMVDDSLEHSERTKAGLAAARARGRIGGRTSNFTDQQVLQLANLGTSKGAARLGMSKSGFIKRLKQAQERAADVSSVRPNPEGETNA